MAHNCVARYIKFTNSSNFLFDFQNKVLDECVKDIFQS